MLAMSNNFSAGNTKSLIAKLIIIPCFIVTGLLSLLPITSSYSIDVFKSASTSASNNQSNENITNNTTTASISPQSYDRLKKCSQDQHTPTNGITYLTHFSCGHVTILQNGTTLRSFSLIAQENVSIPIANNGLNFNA